MVTFVGSPVIDIGLLMTYDGLGEFYWLGGGGNVFIASPIIALGAIEVSGLYGLLTTTL